MSFTFNWPRFSDQFHYDAIQMLNTALNKGSKPPIIADKIEVVELEMGTQPPELEIRDIGDLTVDQFRGIFRMTYSGDAHLVLKTKVQANPLNHKQSDIHLMGGSSGMLAAKHPLVVPMLLRLSHFKLSSYVVLVVSKQKGITLVFKTDPLQNVDINSTFDSIAVIQNFIQHEIEGQLRQMFREDLPGIIHRLSQQWVKAKVEAPYLNKRPPPPSTTRMFETMSSPDTIPSQLNIGDVSLHPHLTRKLSSSSPASRRPRSTSGMSVASGSRHPSTRFSPPIIHDSSHADFDNFDPTYGLRPEGVPTKSGFKGFSALFAPNKGLADLAEETSDAGDYDRDENASFDFVDWDDSAPSFTPPQSVYSDKDSSTEYETIPAVGGGTITRPRIYHSQSAIQPHSSIATPLSKSLSSLPLNSRSLSQASILRSGAGAPSLPPRYPLAALNPYFPDYPGLSKKSSFSSGGGIPGPSRVPRTTPPLSYISVRPLTPDSLESQPSRSSSGPTLSTDPTEHTPYDQDSNEYAIYMRRPATEHRRMSVTSTTTINTTRTMHTSNTNMEFTTPSPPPSYFSHPLDPNISHSHSNSQYHTQDPAKIVLRPSINNNSIHQLSTLSHSNHTLSPYTRDLSHFTVRSVPPRVVGVGAAGGVGIEKQQAVKAKRKRTYRLGGKKTSASDAAPALPATVSREWSRDTTTEHRPSPPSSPTPPSEFDASDMDRYFRMRDSIPGVPPSSGAAALSNPLRIRKRQPYRPGVT